MAGLMNDIDYGSYLTIDERGYQHIDERINN